MTTQHCSSKVECNKKSGQAHPWYIPLQGNMNVFGTDYESFPISCHVKFAWNNDLK